MIRILLGNSQDPKGGDSLMPEEIQCVSCSPSAGFCRACLIPLESDASKRPWRWTRGQALTLLIELCQGPNLQNQELNSCTAKWLGDVSACQQLWGQVVIRIFSAGIAKPHFSMTSRVESLSRWPLAATGSGEHLGPGGDQLKTPATQIWIDLPAWRRGD